jgi:anti-sigma factor RsiW
MKPESLDALLIDRELGELSPETAELLAAWLAEHPESAATVPSIHRTVETTSAAVRRFPELGRPESNVIALPSARFRVVPFALAASILVLLGGTAWLGFHAGRQSAQEPLTGSHREPPMAASANAAKQNGPWARYTVVSDPQGGLTVVRLGKPQS